MKVLERKVAWVAGGGEGLGREVALLLAARGASVVVSGPNERQLGETVGEIAFGGGKARHVVVPGADVPGLARAAERARAVFGGLDLACGAPEDEPRVRAAAGPGVAFVALSGHDPAPVVDAAGRALSP